MSPFAFGKPAHPYDGQVMVVCAGISDISVQKAVQRNG
jgi:hypothetical protein